MLLLAISTLPRTPHSNEWRIHFHVPLHRSALCTGSIIPTTICSELSIGWQPIRGCGSHLENGNLLRGEVPAPPELKGRDVVRSTLVGPNYDWNPVAAIEVERGLCMRRAGAKTECRMTE